MALGVTLDVAGISDAERECDSDTETLAKRVTDAEGVTSAETLLDADGSLVVDDDAEGRRVTLRVGVTGQPVQ